MTITDKLLTKGASHGRTCEPLTPKGVVIHYVGNPGSSAAGNRDYFEGGGSGASAHYVVGLSGEIVRCIPENERAMHAGKSYAAQYDETAKTNNAKYIGIENCHPDSAGKFNDKTYASLVELAADICVRYRFELRDVYRHYDVTGKQCPLYYVNNGQAWDKMKADIGAAVTARLAVSGTTILSALSYSAAKLAAWAKSKGAADVFVSLADKYVKYGKERGVDALVAYSQAAYETAWGKFGGVLDASYRNPCGMKNADGGGDYDKNAHKRFSSWDEGVIAHIDHLALYAGANGYPRVYREGLPTMAGYTPDPRHFTTIKGTARTVEELGGKWAGSLYYGVEVAKTVKSAGDVSETVTPGSSTTTASNGAAGNASASSTAATPSTTNTTNTASAKPEPTAKDKLAALIKDSAIQSPEYWVNALTDFKYFEGFVAALWAKYEGGGR